MGKDMGYYSDEKLLEVYRKESKSANLITTATVIFTFSAIWIGYVFCDLILPLLFTIMLACFFASAAVWACNDYEKEIAKRNLKIE